MTEIKMTLFSHSRKHLIVNTTLPQYDLEQIQGSCFLFTYDKIKEKSPKLLGFFVCFVFVYFVLWCQYGFSYQNECEDLHSQTLVLELKSNVSCLHHGSETSLTLSIAVSGTSSERVIVMKL